MAGGGTLYRPFDPEGQNRYVLKGPLNGTPLTRSWFRHEEIKDGEKLVLMMGTAPSALGWTEPPAPAVRALGEGLFLARLGLRLVIVIRHRL